MNWWLQQALSLQIFYGIGIVAGVFLIIEVILTLFGVDHHNATEASFDHPDDVGFLSLRTITGFFFGFGWTGVIAIKNGYGVPAAMLAACVVGSIFLFGLYGLIRALLSLRSSGNLDYQNAVGQVATVYVTIPPARSGAGQVELLVQGRLVTVSAMTAGEKPLAPQSKVKVTELIDRTTLHVEPL